MTDFVEVLKDHRNWKPAPDCIFIQQQEPAKMTKGGVHLPDISQTPPDAYRVVGTGSDVKNVQVGDFITAESHVALQSSLPLFAGQRVFLLKAKDVAATLNPECLPKEKPDAQAPV